MPHQPQRRARTVTWNLGDGLGLVLSALVLVTWPTTTALRLVILVCGALALAPWTYKRLRQTSFTPWWSWLPAFAGLGLLVWSVVSAIGSNAPPVLSLYGWYGRDGGILMLIAAVILLLTAACLRLREVVRVLWWIAAAASVSAVVSIAQALGWTAYSSPLSYRGSGGLLANPNFSAAFLSISALLSLALAIQATSVRARLLAILATSTQSIGMLLAMSQQGPLSLAIGAIGGCILLGLSNRRSAVRWISGTVGALLALVTAGAVALGLWGFGPMAALIRSDTLAIRLEYWKASWATLQSLPIFGTGPDGLARYISEFRPESYVELLTASNRVDAAHNVLLQYGATLGIPGLLLWLTFSASVTGLLVWGATKRWRGLEGRSLAILAGVGSAWIAYLAQSMVSIDMVVLMAVGWSLAGMSVCIVRGHDWPSANPGSAARTPRNSQGRDAGPVLVMGSLSVLLALLGGAIAIPGLLAERPPSVTSVAEADQVLASSLTPCPTRLTILNRLATQVEAAVLEPLVRSAVASDPRCPPLTAFYAEVARQTGALAVARDQSLIATQQDPLDYQTWLIRAQVLQASGDLPGARDAYGEAVRIFDFAGGDQAYIEKVGEELAATPG